MTWAEFKAAIEAKGVMDGDPIAYIDIVGYEVEDGLKIKNEKIAVWDGWQIWT